MLDSFLPAQRARELARTRKLLAWLELEVHYWRVLAWVLAWVLALLGQQGQQQQRQPPVEKKQLLPQL